MQLDYGHISYKGLRYTCKKKIFTQPAERPCSRYIYMDNKICMFMYIVEIGS